MSVEVAFTQIATSQQQVNYQAAHHDAMGVATPMGESGEATVDPGPQIEALEEPHENDQASKSGEMLGRSEFETWNVFAAGVDGAPGNSH